MGPHGSKTAEADGDSRRVLDSIRRIVQALRLFDRECERRAGLSGAQVFVLQRLGDGEGISINQLAERTHTHQSSVSVVIRKLAERKLVRRESSAADSRRAELFLTAQGNLMLKRLPPAAQDRLVAALEGLSARRRRYLAKLLGELTEQTGLGEQHPPLFFEDHPCRSKRSGSHRNRGMI